MKFLSKHFGRHAATLPSRAALDEEALRLGSVLEHIDRQGNLDDFSGTQSEKLALMRTANRRGLVSWNSTASRYDLTNLGRQQLLPPGTAGYAPPVSAGARGTTRVQPASPFTLNALIVSATCAALGVTAITLALGTYEVAVKDFGVITNRTNAERPIEPSPGNQVTPSMGRQSATTTPRVPGELDGPSNKSAPAAEKPALARPPTEPATQQAPAEAPGSRHAATATGLARGPEQSPAGTRQLDEGGPSIPDPPIGHPIAAGSKPMGPKGRHAGGHQEQPARSSARIKQGVVQPQFGTEARLSEKRKRGSGRPMQAWTSAKTINVNRKGQLVREERKLGDGTVVVRYQYGNGPPHFERRSGGTRDRTLGYSDMAQESRFGSLDGPVR